MKRVSVIGAAVVIAAAAAGYFSTSGSQAQTKPSGVDRMYVLDCGVGHATDESRWSPGVNVGKPVDISVSCYLIRHAKGYFLWDTGISDRVAELPRWIPGDGNPQTAITWNRAKTLASQLAELNVAPSDIGAIGISHTHPDHIGNIEMFPDTEVDIQRAEFDNYFAGKPIEAPPGDTKPTFSKNHKVKLVDEDLDVFGDGSVLIFYTPGHTPGHQSLLVRLPKTGAVVLTGDAVHLRGNWDHRRIPYFQRQSTEQKLQFLTSMQRMADIMAFYHAQIWILHDKAQTDAQKHSPAYYE